MPGIRGPTALILRRTSREGKWDCLAASQVGRQVSSQLRELAASWGSGRQVPVGRLAGKVASQWVW